MALPLTTVTFSGTGSATIRATAPDTDCPVTVPGVTHRTQGGALVSYQVGPTYWEVTLQAKWITSAQKDALETFFRANRGTFTYADENGNEFTAQFLDQSLPLRKGFRDSWDCNIHLNLSSVLK